MLNLRAFKGLIKRDLREFRVFRSPVELFATQYFKTGFSKAGAFFKPCFSTDPDPASACFLHLPGSALFRFLFLPGSALFGFLHLPGSALFHFLIFNRTSYSEKTLSGRPGKRQEICAPGFHFSVDNRDDKDRQLSALSLLAMHSGCRGTLPHIPLRNVKYSGLHFIKVCSGSFPAERNLCRSWYVMPRR